MCFYRIIDISPIPSRARSYIYAIEELREIGNHALQNARHKTLSPGTTKQVCKLRINRIKIWNSHRKVYKQNEINHKNLTYVKITNNNGTSVKTTTRLILLNARSIKKKNHIIIAELENNKIEIAIHTETWIKSNQQHKAWLNQSKFKQGNYYIITHKWLGDKQGGGVAIVFRKDLDVAHFEANNTPTMEYSIWKYIKKNKLVHIIGIYHPPPNSENVTTNVIFLYHLTELPKDKLTQLENNTTWRFQHAHRRNTITRHCHLQ